MLNQRGEATLAVVLFVMAFVVGTHVEMDKKDKDHKKQLHYERYHKKAMEHEVEVREELRKAEKYKI